MGKGVLFGTVLLLTVALDASAEGRRFVDDFLVLVLRAEPSEGSERLGNVATGEGLQVLEDGPRGYVRVRLDDGTEGWLKGQYLVANPPGRLRLEETEERLKTVLGERDQLRSLSSRLEQEKEAALAELAARERALAELRAATPAPGRQAARKARLAELAEESRLLRLRNRELQAEREQAWFLVGGGVALASLLIGLWIGRAVGRRRSGWS